MTTEDRTPSEILNAIEPPGTWHQCADTDEGTETVFSFATEAEARAFVQGIEYANDSALTAKPPEQRENRWYVDVIDQDRHHHDDDSDRCEECGAIIPTTDGTELGGRIENRHHAKHCSLYDQNHS